MRHVEQAYRVAGFIAGAIKDASGREGSAADRTFNREALARFVAAYPPAPAGAGYSALHARLRGAPNRDRLRAFGAWLGSEKDSLPKMQLMELLRKVYAPEPPPKPPRPEIAFGPADALRAIARLGEPSFLELPPDEATRIRVIVENAVGLWSRKVRDRVQSEACLDCHRVQLHPLCAGEHLPHCEGHPATLRLMAAKTLLRFLHDEWKIGMDLEDPTARTAVPSVWPGDEYDLKRKLERLCDPAARSLQPSKNLAEDVARLTAAVTQWAHFADRTTDPCPWCGAVVPYDCAIEHLRTCDAHPDAVLAREVEEAIRVELGARTAPLMFWMTERLQLRWELVLLDRATTTYDQNMGWSGGAGYSEEWSERPWRAAQARAQAAVGLPEMGPALGPRAPNWVERSLANLLSEPDGETARTFDDDKRRLELVARQVDLWRAAQEGPFICAGCRRPGVGVLQWERHVTTCLGAPAVRRTRRALAVLSVLEPDRVNLSRRRVSLFRPTNSDAFLSEYRKKERTEAFARLFTYHPSELRQNDRAALEELVRDWHGLRRVRSPFCPWCGMEAAKGHLMGCDRHPIRPYERLLTREIVSSDEVVDPRLNKLARWLCDEADRYAMGIARLVSACAEFFNGMSDGERGQSLSNPRIERMLRAARDDVARVLKRPDAAGPRSNGNG